MKLYPAKSCCGADLTAETAVIERQVLTGPSYEHYKRKRAKMVFHVKGQMRFWHWTDQQVVIPCSNNETG